MKAGFSFSITAIRLHTVKEYQVFVSILLTITGCERNKIKAKPTTEQMSAAIYVCGGLSHLRLEIVLKYALLGMWDVVVVPIHLFDQHISDEYEFEVDGVKYIGTHDRGEPIKFAVTPIGRHDTVHTLLICTQTQGGSQLDASSIRETFASCRQVINHLHAIYRKADVLIYQLFFPAM